MKIDFKKTAVSLSQAQTAIFLSTQNQEEKGFNNPLLLKFKNKIDEKKLSLAISKAVNNHPGLFSSVFIDKDGLPKIKYNEEFAKKDICEIIEIDEKGFNKIKEKLIEPFDITKDRLFRFKLFKSSECVRLFMDIHHIVFDGYSLKILLQSYLRFI